MNKPQILVVAVGSAHGIFAMNDSRRPPVPSSPPANSGALIPMKLTAIEILIEQQSDPPSAVLIERCRGFLHEPPPPNWRGAHFSLSK
jgi:hypothetical protein